MESRYRSRPRSAPGGRSMGRPRILLRMVLWISLAVVLLPAVPGAVSGLAGAIASPPTHPAGPAAFEPPPPASIHLGPYLLTNGAHVDVGPLVPYVLARERADARRADGTGLASTAPGAAAPEPSRLRGRISAGEAGPVYARSVHPLAVGGVSGTVVDSVTGLPVSGANVTLVPEPAQPCGGAVNCSPALTNAAGKFTVYGPAGLAEIQITAANYLENDTLVQVPSGSILSLGTVPLQHDAYVSGTVRGSDPSHETVDGNAVRIESGSRNFTLLGGTGTPNATGQFLLEVPPVPDFISFLPALSAGPYLENTTYFDPAPHATVSLGTIYLPTGTAVNITVVDRSTGRTIPNATFSAWACQADSGSCPFSVATTRSNSSGPWTVYALPGPTFLKVAALGYVANVTGIGTVPGEPSGHSVSAVVELVPDAVLVFQTNVTGGDVPSAMANLTYGLAQTCSLDSVQNGFLTNGSVAALICTATTPGYQDFSPGQVLFIPPLRSETEFLSHWVGINPGPPLLCARDCKDNTLLYFPIYFNQTVVNATPGEVIDIGTVNSTPGGWINGSVVVAGTHSAPSEGFTVTVCSTAIGGWCDNSTSSPNDSTRWYHDCPGTFGPTYFCAPSPPGPILITVLAPGYTANETWGNLPFECCNRLGPDSPGISLAEVTTDHSPVINMSGPGTGTVTGRVLARLADGGAMAIGGGSVQNCPVLANSLLEGCNTTLTDPNGSFSFPALRGWEQIIGSASNMTSNSTWIDLAAYNTTGTIWLAPPAEVAGNVVTPVGTPVSGATVEICPASLPAVCRPLGSGVTTAGGAFAAAYPGSAFPGNAYRIVADAAGYTEGAAWGNLTDGNLTDVGNIVLVPVGNGTALPAGSVRPRNSSATAPIWLDGTVVDNRSGTPLWGYAATACPVLSPTRCLSLTSSISNPAFGGNFNASVPQGPTWINVSETGFVSRSVYANLSGAVEHLGRIALDPLPRLTGRVLFANWTSATVAEGLAPNAATVSLCDLSTGACGVPTNPSANGTVNLSGPAGPSDTLSVVPDRGTLPVDYLGPGVASIALSVDMPADGGALPTQPGKAPELPVYTKVSGRIGDGSTANATAHRPAGPLRYGSVSVKIPAVGEVAAVLTGNGTYTLLLPTGTNLTLRAEGASYWTDSATFVSPAEPQGTEFENMDLGRFGWINLEVLAGSGSSAAGVAEAPVSAAVWDPGNSTYVMTSGVADAVGYANLSAPPGSVVVSVTDPATGQTVNTSASVHPSRTTVVSLPVITGGGSSTVFWLASQEVNTVGVPLVTTVRDPVSGGPVGAATVQVDNNLGEALTSGTTATNALGQFLLAAPAAPGEGFSVSAPGYLPNGTLLPPTGAVVRYRELNLTGDGVIAGTVLDAGTGLPVDGATVSACLEQAAGACLSVGTNASGGYWISLPPGLIGLQYSAVGYVANQSLQIRVCSDCFVEASGVVLWRDALLEGTVENSVTAVPLGGAQLTLCPIGSFNVGYCNFGTPVTSAPDGSFALEPPMGSYLFNVSYPGFVPISISMDLGVGQVVDLGTLALLPDGTLIGAVVSGQNGDPLANVTVAACLGSAAGTCATGVTNGSGIYTILAAPGHYELLAVAPGFGEATATTNVGATVTTVAPELVLPYEGPGGTFPVAGRVLVLGGNGTGIAGASVTAMAGGVLLGAAETAVDGSFRLDLPWGPNTIAVRAGGYAGASENLTVHGAVTGLSLALPVFRWPIEGTVRSATSGAVAPGVPIEEEGRPLNVTGAAGEFSFALTNGSYLLTAGGPANGVEVYDPLPFPVAVAGPVAPLELSLAPHLVTVNLTALDAGTGALVAAADFTITGTPLSGGSENVTLSLQGNVWASTALPLGTYLVSAQATAYAPVSRQFSVVGPPVSVSVAMNRTAGISARALPGTEVAALAGLAILLLLAGTLLTRRRRRRLRRVEGVPVAPAETFDPDDLG